MLSSLGDPLPSHISAAPGEFPSPRKKCRKFYASHTCVPSVSVIVSPVRSTYGGYYGLVVVTPPPPRPPPRPQTLHRSHDNLKNPYRIASIFYM